jgi:hypothetical protein
MRNGFQVYDTDTHVMPAAEVLQQYVEPGFRPRLAELDTYLAPLGDLQTSLEAIYTPG